MHTVTVQAAAVTSYHLRVDAVYTGLCFFSALAVAWTPMQQHSNSLSANKSPSVPVQKYNAATRLAAFHRIKYSLPHSAYLVGSWSNQVFFGWNFSFLN